MKKTSSQQSYYLFQVRFVGLVEGAKVSTVNVEYGDDLFVANEGNDNLAIGGRGACDMTGKLMHVGNDNCLFLLP